MLHIDRSISVHASQSLLVPLVQAGDAAIILIALWQWCLIHQHHFGVNYLVAGTLGISVFYFLAGFSDSYRTGRGAVFCRPSSRILLSWFFTAATVLLVGYSLEITDRYSRLVILSWFISVPIAMLIERTATTHLLGALRRRGWNSRRVAIAGINPTSLRLASGIASIPESGLILQGFYSDSSDTEERGTSLPAAFRGSLSDLELAVGSGLMDVVYIVLPMSKSADIFRLANSLRMSRATVFFVPDLLTFDLVNSRITDVGGVPAISLCDTPFYGVDGIVKRIEDIFVASIALVIFAIPMLFIALAIKIAMGGPVIFTQLRYGRDGRPVKIYKFRTMSVCEDGAEARQATRNDFRITRIGAILRKSSLDELPQFINVLQGRMSVVGPRPHPTALDDAHRMMIDGYSIRHRVRPGITGLAQVNGFRGETDRLEKMEGRIRNDLMYINDWSVWLDLKIIVKTIFTGFSRANAC